MFLHYNMLIAEITENDFHGNADGVGLLGSPQREAGLRILADSNGTVSNVLIQDNDFGTDDSTANQIGLYVRSVNGATVNLNVIDNTFYSVDESVRIIADLGVFQPNEIINLNLFGNETNTTYLLNRGVPLIGSGATFRLGYDVLDNATVFDQLEENGNTTNGGTPVVDDDGDTYEFITRDMIPLPNLFP